MKKLLLSILIVPCLVFSQNTMQMEYEPGPSQPFGVINPEAPKEVADFAPLIGTCDCESIARNNDQTWAEPQQMTWTFKYIMNGMAVQDETLKEDGGHSGSIRQFIADSSKWYVHYYSNKSPSTSLSSWEGGKRGDSIVLYRDQKAPNGTDGFYRLTFSNISEEGFNWVGEWTNTTETFTFPTWKINCIKRSPVSAKRKIEQNIKAFSEAYINGDIEALSNLYTEDGKIFPNNSDIISNRTAIKKWWVLPEGEKVLEHVVTPSEIKIINNYAYDYGYYEGKSLNKDKKESSWKGKYVIVWKKTGNDWKIHLDIWNRL